MSKITTAVSDVSPKELSWNEIKDVPGVYSYLNGIFVVLDSNPHMSSAGKWLMITKTVIGSPIVDEGTGWQNNTYVRLGDMIDIKIDTTK